jgi:hypothetical protein
MRWRWPRIVALGGWMLALAFSPARAHNPLTGSTDPFQGWVVARLRPDHLDFEVRLARTLAYSLVGLTAAPTSAVSAELPTLSVSTMPLPPDPLLMQAYPLLVKLAPSLYQITDDGAALHPQTVEISVASLDGDIRFLMTYPRPAPGPLRFQANYFQQMPATHTDAFQVVNDTGQTLAQADLTQAKPGLDFTLSPPRRLAGGTRRWLEWGAVLLVAAAVGIFWRTRLHATPAPR